MEKKIEEIIEQFAFDKYHEVEDSRWFEPLQEGAKWMHYHILSNPSEFGLVKKEEYDNLKQQADEMRMALSLIASAPQPFNEREHLSWIGTARDIAQQTLTNYENQVSKSI